MFVRACLSVIVTFICINCFAQDPEFSQFYSNPLYYNPAFAGVKDGPRFILDFRDQWPNLNQAFVSYSASYDQFFDNLRSGIGVIVMGDEQGGGIYNSVMADAMYSYQIKISDNFNVNMAMEGGWFQSTLNWQDAVFLDQLNPFTPNTTIPTTQTEPLDTKVSGPDFGTGLLAYSKHVYFGFSVQHLFTPHNAFYNTDAAGIIPRRISANLGYEVTSERNVNHNFYFSPNAIYLQQAGQNQLNLGFFMGITPIYIGFYYREDFTNPDAFIFMVGFTQGIFKAGYSYDITVSGLSGYTGGAHELTLIVNLADRKNATKDQRETYIHELQCPDIF
jgi:type IX secretion system PorP/SprF family membrane protein